VKNEPCDPFWRIADAGAFIAAIDRELGDRQRDHAAKVRKGAMHQAEADHVLALVADIRADLLHYFGPVPDEEPRQPPREDPLFPWADKVRWIRRERDELEDKSPELVAKGRMTFDDAKRLTAMFGTLHRLYWRGMFMWRPPEGPAADYLRELRGAAVSGRKLAGGRNDGAGALLYRQLVREHMAQLDAEDSDSQGRLVA
jgi:hypothetical protein